MQVTKCLSFFRPLMLPHQTPSFIKYDFTQLASACEALKLCRCNTHKVMNVFEPNKTFYLHPNKNIGFNQILGLLQIKNVFTKKFQNLSYYYVAKTIQGPRSLVISHTCFACSCTVAGGTLPIAGALATALPKENISKQPG